MPISEKKQEGNTPDNHHLGIPLSPKCHYVKGKKHRSSGIGTKCAPNLNVLLIIILGIIPVGLINNPIPAAATPAAFNATSPIDNSLMTFNATSVTNNAMTNNLTPTRP